MENAFLLPELKKLILTLSHSFACKTRQESSASLLVYSCYSSHMLIYSGAHAPLSSMGLAFRRVCLSNPNITENYCPRLRNHNIYPTNLSWYPLNVNNGLKIKERESEKNLGIGESFSILIRGLKPLGKESDYWTVSN